MAEPIETKRRLAAIFAADVEGYSRLMGSDEVATLDALTARREILDGLIATHGNSVPGGSEPMLAKMAAKREAGYKALGYEVTKAAELFSRVKAWAWLLM